MQDRSRYINVSLGIGGWQPFDATFVHEHSYGDCKALSNYMVAILKEVGITAYSTDIRSGHFRRPFIEEFPSAQFNHVIACVPLQPDTIWLECTNRTIPMGHLSHSTENRGALLLTPDGGVVIRTPSTRSTQNTQKRNASVNLYFNGSADVNCTIKWNGDQQDHVRDALAEATPEERERWVLDNLGVPNANLKQFNFDGLDKHELEIGQSLQIGLPRFASVSGDRMFFLPNLMERRTSVPADVAKRLSPVRYDYPYLDNDSISYSIPKGFVFESIPKEVKLEASFGRYTSRTVAVGDSCIIYTRSMEIRDYSIPAANYGEYRKFFIDIVKADRAQVVLVRRQE